MRLTTANIKNQNYDEKHEIYVGTHTGTFKRLNVAQEKPHSAVNLQCISTLDKHSAITALEYGNKEKTEVLIGRANKFVKVYDIASKDFTSNLEFSDAPIVGLARYDGKIVAGLASGKIEVLQNPKIDLLTTGDNMSRFRQCPLDEKLVATGGKQRQNNLKIFNLEEMKLVFTSKNVRNDFLELEVPIWDSDLNFLDPSTLVTCSRYGYVRFYDIRKQRRPIHSFLNENNEFSFSCLAARDNYIYVGTTMGGLKAMDIRNLKNFVHTYKGFTGSVSDLSLDESGKYLVSGSLDRYVRVHHTDSCAMMYQCYVKSKANRVLVTNENSTKLAEDSDNDCEIIEKVDVDEYDAIFEKMETISESETIKRRKCGSSVKTKVMKMS